MGYIIMGILVFGLIFEQRNKNNEIKIEKKLYEFLN